MPESTSWARPVGRGLRKRCPRCGDGRLFSGWNALKERCDRCGLLFEPLAGSSWWFMYYSTACLSGMIIVAMLLVVPANHLLGRAAVLLAWLVLMLLSLPRRKGVAIALDYLMERRQANE